MHGTRPFFTNLLSNMNMVLAKTDLAVASRNAQLVSDSRLRKFIFDRIALEQERTLTAFAAIAEANERLAENLHLARAIKNRLPYLDPLNHFATGTTQATPR